MPVFGTPFDGNNLDRKISKEELIRTLRFSIAAELEAIQLYMQIVDVTTDQIVKKVLTDIANEERVHVGEFMRLLFHIEPKEQKFYEDGFREVESIIKSKK